jgi:hypothetical protein
VKLQLLPKEVSYGLTVVELSWVVVFSVALGGDIGVVVVVRSVTLDGDIGVTVVAFSVMLDGDIGVVVVVFSVTLDGDAGAVVVVVSELDDSELISDQATPLAPKQTAIAPAAIIDT